MVLPSDVRTLFGFFLDKQKGESTCTMTELVSRKFFTEKGHEVNLRRGKAERIVNVSRHDFLDSGWEATV